MGRPKDQLSTSPGSCSVLAPTSSQPRMAPALQLHSEGNSRKTDWTPLLSAIMGLTSFSLAFHITA